VIGRLVVACVVFGAAIASPRHLVAQGSAVPEGSTGSTWAGVALGGYSGTVLGLIGSMLPCNRTLAGAGGLVGGQNQDEIVRRAQNAGWGALVGGMAGAALWKSVRQYGWADAMAVAAVGGAIGTAPQGAGLGGAVGATTGAVVWLVTPESGLPNFVMLTMAGVAVGGMLEWALTAGDANRSEPLFTPSFSIPVR
jgi:hypothetical protein